jgi:hypothetical protein
MSTKEDNFIDDLRKRGADLCIFGIVDSGDRYSIETAMPRKVDPQALVMIAGMCVSIAKARTQPGCEGWDFIERVCESFGEYAVDLSAPKTGGH